MDILEHFKQQQLKDVSRPALRAGDTVRVHTKVKEAGKTRIQVFEGIVLAVRGSGPSRMVTIRRAAGGFSVERIFPIFSPLIEKIDVVRRQKVRRAKLTYLRHDKRRKVKDDTRGDEPQAATETPAEEITTTEAAEPQA